MGFLGLLGDDKLLNEAMMACRTANLSLLSSCLDGGVDVNAPLDTKGRRLLHVVCRQVQRDVKLTLPVVQLLVERGADLSLRSDNGETPLQALLSYAFYGVHHHTISSQQAQSLAPLAIYLMDKGSPLLPLDSQEISPLHCASGVGNDAVVKALLDAGVPVDPLICLRGTPLWTAASLGFESTALLLLERGASPQVADNFSNNGESVLSLACKEGLVDLFEAMMRRGLDLKEPAQLRSLLKAAQGGHIDIAQRLLDAGVPLATVNEKGNGALHMAAASGESAMCSWLIAQGIDAQALNLEQRTAKGLARDNGQMHIVNLIDACVGARMAHVAIESMLNAQDSGHQRRGATHG